MFVYPQQTTLLRQQWHNYNSKAKMPPFVYSVVADINVSIQRDYPANSPYVVRMMNLTSGQFAYVNNNSTAVIIYIPYLAAPSIYLSGTNSKAVKKYINKNLATTIMDINTMDLMLTAISRVDMIHDVVEQLNNTMAEIKHEMKNLCAEVKNLNIDVSHMRMQIAYYNKPRKAQPNGGIAQISEAAMQAAQAAPQATPQSTSRATSQITPLAACAAPPRAFSQIAMQINPRVAPADKQVEETQREQKHVEHFNPRSSIRAKKLPLAPKAATIFDTDIEIFEDNVIETEPAPPSAEMD